MPAKIVLPPKTRPITFILFKANSFWFPPSSDPRGIWSPLPLTDAFLKVCSSELLAKTGLWQVIQGLPLCELWHASINQFDVMLLSY